MKKFLYRIGILTISIVCFASGYVVHRNELIPAWLRSGVRSHASDADRPARDRGEWYPHVPARGSGKVLDGDYTTKEALESIGYLQGYTAAPKDSEVIIHNKDKAYEGMNLYSSGHAPKAYLMDMEGKVVHTWSYDFWSIWPDYSPPEYMRVTGDAYWRRVHLYDNGDLLAIHEGIGLIKLDRDSNLLWSYRAACHHDLAVSDEGLIYVLTREAKLIARFSKDDLSLEPSITVLSDQGEELRRVSLLECFDNSDYKPMLSRLPLGGDLFHTNTIEILDGSWAQRMPAFQQGNVLISIWSLDAVAVINLQKISVEWVLTSMWRRQHQPTILDNGHMLIFDNRGGPNERSRVIEFDPVTQEVAWKYEGTEEEKFYSMWCGSSARLPNGNTLVTETNNGRAFEVTAEKEIVWEYINPHQVEEQDLTLIASLWEVIRLKPDFGREWLKR